MGNKGSSSDKSSRIPSDEIPHPTDPPSVPGAVRGRENPTETESASPSPGTSTGGMGAVSPPLEHPNPEPVASSSRSVHPDDSLLEEVFEMEHQKSLKHFLSDPSSEPPLIVQPLTLEYDENQDVFVDNDLVGNLMKIHAIFLKRNGKGAQVLAKRLVGIIRHIDPSKMNLSDIVYDAYPESVNFSLRTDYLPEAFVKTDPEVLNFLSLQYPCDWPLNIVVTERSIDMYNAAWQFLNSVDITLYQLQEVFDFLRAKHTKLRRDTYKQIQGHQSSMLRLLNALKSYCGSAVADTWAEVRHVLANVVLDNPLAMRRHHDCFLRRLHAKLMLDNSTISIKTQIMKVLHRVLEYCVTILDAPWEHPQTENSDLNTELTGLFKKFESDLEQFEKVVSSFIQQGKGGQMSSLLNTIN